MNAMHDLSAYLLAGSLWLAGLYAYSRLLIRPLNRPGLERAALLLALGLAMAAPRLPQQAAAVFELPVLELSSAPAAPEAGAARAQPVWPLLYFAGVLAGLLLLLVQVLRLLVPALRWRRGHVGHTPVVFTGGRMPAGSFLAWIFWDETQAIAGADREALLIHERCHLRQAHGLDALLAGLLCALFWFHPLAWALRRDLRRTHELLADRAAAARTGTAAYIRLLLSQTLRVPPALLQPFRTSTVKFRIHMLHASVSRRSLRAPLLLLLPVLAALGLLSACLQQESESVAREVTVQPGPVPAAGGNAPAPVALNLDAIRSSIGYPEAAREAGQSGKVIVKVLVSESGAYAQHEVLAGDAPLLVAAVEAQLPQLQFEPARDASGKALAAWVAIPFNFVLLD